ncbi:hypothetical protein ACI3ET_09780 [Ornithinimicrobium sp. LYQ121]|uniref:hypothetical protein n=1 Tax=Ornithinimicrobium sp. LYQ121 TaxID=3378801 RepID=UPI003852FBC1
MKSLFEAQQMNIGFSGEVFDKLRSAITEYLAQHESIAVTSTFTTESLGYSGARGGDYTRPFTLLRKAARQSRLAVVGAHRQRQVPRPPPEVWDIVGGDPLLASPPHRAARVASWQLRQIDEIKATGPSDKGCTALITLMRREPELTYA